VSEPLTTLLSWIRGDLSPEERIWSAAAPAIAVLAYMILGMVAFAVRNALHGRYRDAETEARGASLLLGMWLRQYFTWLMRPLLGMLLRARVPSNAVTTLSLLLATGAAVALAAGRMALGGWLFVAAGVCDFLDGRLARQSNTASPSGALLDSVLDRYVEAVIFVGLAWFYRDSWVLIAVLAALTGSMLVPYVRARAEALGVEFGNFGFVQRPERVLILGIALGLSPIIEALWRPHEERPMHVLAVAAIVGLAAATQVTALQRLVYGHRSLSNPSRRRMHWRGRGGVVRNALSSGIATASDFGIVVALASVAGLVPALATLLGCAAGGVINFTLNRLWAFEQQPASTRMAIRYGFVTGSSALLNSGLVAVLLLLPSIHYQIAWVLVRIAVFGTWNYPLHRDYVFAPEVTGHDAEAT
jgi:phosphatidylglycerophosphate synthase/putative flippase GtrA